MNSKPVLVVVDSKEHFGDLATFLRHKMPSAEVHLHSTGVSMTLLKEISEGLKEQSVESELLNVSAKFKECVGVVREEFMDFVANWPDSFKVFGRPFKEFMTERKDLSLWWYCELSQKNLEATRTFDRLCQLYLLKTLVKDNMYAAAVIHTSDSVFRGCVEQCCQNHHLKCYSTLRIPKSQRVVSLLRRISGYLYGRFGHCPRLILYVILVRILYPRNRGGKGKVIFYSWFCSEHWHSYKGAIRDRYYVETPEYLLSNNIEYGYLCQLRERGIRRTLRLLLSLRKRKAFQQPSSEEAITAEAYDRLELVESHMGILDILKNIFAISTTMKYLYCRLLSREFRNSFTFMGLDLYPLFVLDIDSAFFGGTIAEIRSVSHGVERFCRQCSPKALLCWSALYCWGRGVIAGARRGNPQCATIGFQESRITRMTLYYNYRPKETSTSSDEEHEWIRTMPTPDYYLVHGENAKRIFQLSGFPAEHLIVTGAPRFGRLPYWKSQRENYKAKYVDKLLGANAGEKRYLVILGTSILAEDSRDLIEESFPCFAKRNDLFVLIKPHPFNVEPVRKAAEDAASRYGFSDFQMTDTDIQELLCAADAIVISYSGVGGEAVAIGCPAINLSFGYRVSITPFDDFPGASFQVYDSEAMAESLEAIFTHSEKLEEKMAKWPEFLEGTFGFLDDNSDQRILEFLNQRVLEGK